MLAWLRSLAPELPRTQPAIFAFEDAVTTFSAAGSISVQKQEPFKNQRLGK